MNFLRHKLRYFFALQLLPALESPSQEALIGGQAVLEGVMMRSPHAWGIAVRRHTGDIATFCETLQRPSEKRKWLAWPFVRGLVTLGQAMKLGYRALNYSSNIVLASLKPEEEQKNAKPEEISGWRAALSITFSLLFFVAFYKFVPLAAATRLKLSFSSLNNNFLFNLVDGIIRLALFVLFIWALSLMSDMRRLFQYHGAEHKTVFAYEAQRDIPDVSFTQKFSTYHPRCGTSFLMTIMVISIFIYALFPVTTFWARFGLRILLLPVIASVSYEMIRFSAKHGKSLFALLTRPGMWMQRITTKQPSDDMVECAIKALDEAMTLEKTNGGELVIA